MIFECYGIILLSRKLYFCPEINILFYKLVFTKIDIFIKLTLKI